MSSILRDLLKNTFKYDDFRPHQEEICQAVYEGHDVLLVMPTGAGKSACYQLPGLARKGTTLVISPLVALMDDQASKLRALGLRAEQIHSGRDKDTTDDVCDAYLRGEIDFLFVAPERLSTPGFMDILTRMPLGLIAVDEAHCISQWGHDFRSDYRMLGQHLQVLRPAPIIGLTATATTRVQKDIIAQLGLSSKHKLFIHGFRRKNIAVEIVEVSKPDRAGVAHKLISNPENLPAIIYAPTRKEADALARTFNGHIRSAAYHAGMHPEDREQVQSDFLSGKLDVVIATVAFGMGVDKANIRLVVHTALPQSVEGLYQEIGRAGRDGSPSRSLLMYSYADRKLLQFFYSKSYPELSVLQKVFKEVDVKGVPREMLKEIVSFEDEELFNRSLDLLKVHQGVTIDSDGIVHRGNTNWTNSYIKQSMHALQQGDDIWRFAKTTRCRMVQFIQHFGDASDAGHACGVCDVCIPEESIIQEFNPPSHEEVQALVRIMEVLRSSGSASGALYRDNFEGTGQIDRDTYERLLSSLVREKWITMDERSFNKQGKTIYFQRLDITPMGRKIGRGELGELRILRG